MTRNRGFPSQPRPLRDGASCEMLKGGGQGADVVLRTTSPSAVSINSGITSNRFPTTVTPCPHRLDQGGMESLNPSRGVVPGGDDQGSRSRARDELPHCCGIGRPRLSVAAMPALGQGLVAPPGRSGADHRRDQRPSSFTQARNSVSSPFSEPASRQIDRASPLRSSRCGSTGGVSPVWGITATGHFGPDL
jgi:hypothetical protein